MITATGLRWRWAGSVLAVMAVAIAVVLLSIHAHHAYYRTHLTLGDGQISYYRVALTLHVTHDHGLRAGLSYALQSLCVLHQVVAAVLAPALPTAMVIAPLLNGIWYVAMSAVVCCLFLEKTQSAFGAFVLSMPPLLNPALLARPGSGLTNLHADTTAYSLGVSTLCLLILSRGWTRPWYSALSGISVGLLLLGRAPAVAMVAVMAAPLVLVPAAKARSVRGAGLFLVAMLATGGIWLAPHMGELVAYFLAWYGHPRGAVGTLQAWRVPWLLGRYARDVAGGDLAYASCVVVLAGCAIRGQIRFRPRPQLHFGHLWMSISPLLVLLALRTENARYAIPVSFAAYLLLIEPFERAPGPLWEGMPVALRAATVLCALILGLAFARQMRATHQAESTERAGAARLVRALVDHAATEVEPRPIPIVMTYWGTLNIFSLANTLLYDFDEVAVVGSEAVERPAFVIDPAVLWHDTEASAVAEEAALMAALQGSARYLLVLDTNEQPSAATLTRRRLWPGWMSLGRRFLGSPSFTAAARGVQIVGAERVALLVRRGPPRSAFRGERTPRLHVSGEPR
jgi:hypothetical protein